jgi:hypothetical protein
MYNTRLLSRLCEGLLIRDSARMTMFLWFSAKKTDTLTRSGPSSLRQPTHSGSGPTPLDALYLGRHHYIDVRTNDLLAELPFIYWHTNAGALWQRGAEGFASPGRVR